MSEVVIPICESSSLIEGGKGIRFPVTVFDEDTTGFVIRYNSVARAYVNRCAHVPIELDWTEGDFFGSDGHYLMCSTHGAMYAPESGQCLGGPCKGGRLRSIMVIEKDNQVFWQPDEYVRPARA
jgi:nitrite reductase/ring-hydroxylating ferredoxin subunit